MNNIILKPDSKLKVVGNTRGGIKAIRPDGLPVFLDGDPVLDQIREHGTIEEVIMAVAIRRAQQIALDYARQVPGQAETLVKKLESSLSQPAALAKLADASA